MEAHGWRERLWRCTEERCVAWMHRGLELRQRHQSAIVTANIIISKGPQHTYTTWPADLLQFKLDDIVYAIRFLAMNYSSLLASTRLAMCSISDDHAPYTPEIVSFALQHTGLLEMIRSQRVKGSQGKASLPLRHIAEYLMA